MFSFGKPSWRIVVKQMRVYRSKASSISKAKEWHDSAKRPLFSCFWKPPSKDKLEVIILIKAASSKMAKDVDQALIKVTYTADIKR